MTRTDRHAAELAAARTALDRAGLTGHSGVGVVTTSAGTVEILYPRGDDTTGARLRTALRGEGLDATRTVNGESDAFAVG